MPAAMMKAVQVEKPGGPEVLKYIDLPIPTPAAGQVLIRTDTIGVGKYDALVRTGRYPWPVEYPEVPGISVTGYVERVGDGVEGFSPGQPVLAWKFSRRCYAEYVACDVHEITKLPEGIDIEGAVAIPDYQVAWGMLNDAADLRRVKVASINGATGGVGCAMIDLCRAAGIQLIAVCRAPNKAAFALERGASYAIDSSSEAVGARILDITKGTGVDLMFDQLVGPDFRDNIKLVAPLGQIVTFNALSGLPSSDLFADLRKNMDRSISVRAYSVHVYDPFPQERVRIASEVFKLVEARAINPSVTVRLPLREAVQAHRMLDGREVMGKLVLKP
ncbi:MULTISPECIES: quinone oxidoreductase family protein [Bradyrhizobium]|uniref:Enoyl reductase (ER) domain-containing protein n=3 Tax=Bradyrhizobium TaxID=374 RepID=A0AAE6CCJ7_9BRAD|nr:MULTISPECIES: zinc-binding dehydrogenase [Bradyrhizobium]MCG2628234.1 zinc-binding dehydrogenase [Bradyrhizobium zhengyangense]MCG2643353.1 zinc-binding dehydrogenase [Bradyrhizobium zhengyangense]MCG2670333.1 zinc-binding dehydrogenase [Bradyrhizobium zhengyangense]MDN4985932.1 zinc-binding dehydrogenase [Bradyrhizobium sp. WYCCWR 13022]MDN5002688.1 zinc-binding dehydrogenase [Bradyrhizobium sp. WYCCWR 12677]